MKKTLKKKEECWSKQKKINQLQEKYTNNIDR